MRHSGPSPSNDEAMARMLAYAYAVIKLTKRTWSLKKGLCWRSESRVAETDCPFLDLSFQCLDVWVCFKAVLEVLEFLALRLLDLERDLAATIEELSNLLEVLRCATACCHRWRADAHAARRQRRGVAVHRITVQRDGADLADLLHLGAREPVGP